MKYRKTKGYKYILEEEFRVFIEIEEPAWNNYISLDRGFLIIRKGYAWDGSSVPLKKLWRPIFDSDKYCKKASIVHDCLCQLMRESLLPKTFKEYADQFYKQMCIEGGMSKRQAGLRYWVLRKFGEVGIRKRKKPRGKIFET